MQKKWALSLIALMAYWLLGTAPSVQAGQRVDEVNSRLENQSGRIQQGKGKHKMSAAQQTRADEASYRMASEEQRMRTRHKGTLTKRDQNTLNRQLNRNSQRIRNDKGNG